MKKLLDLLTGIAGVVFAMSLCGIESLSPATLAALLISGGWLTAYAMAWNEKSRAGQPRGFAKRNEGC